MDALALLRLYMEWGADEALEEAPVARLHPPAAIRAVAGSGQRPGVPPATVAPTPVAVPENAAEAASLQALRAAIAGFTGCALRDTATNLVFADGNPDAGLLIVGEAPNAADDRSGRAFDGPAGALLDRMLASIGLDRGDALLTPLIPWRPPGGRPPNASEIGACLPFVHRLIALTAPRRLVLLGPLAAKTLLGAAPRRRTPGWLPVTVPGLPEPLPALVLPGLETLATSPASRRAAWAGLRLLKRDADDKSAKS